MKGESVLKALIVLGLIIVAMGYLSHSGTSSSGSSLLNSTYVYENYLEPYDEEGYRLLAAHLRIWHPSETVIEWKVYLYHPNGTLVFVHITEDGASSRKYSTSLDYSSISMPLSALKNLGVVEEKGYVNRLYFLNETDYRIMEDEYKGIARCRNITSLLSGRSLKLLRGVKVGGETGLMDIRPAGGVFVITGSYSYRPLCRETWLVVEPYNETHDRVGVIYPDAAVWGLVPFQNLPVFNGSDYVRLMRRFSEKLSWGDVEGTLINATGIYVNPHAKEIFERGYRRGSLPGISGVVVFRNGTVKTWGVWINRGRVLDS